MSRITLSELTEIVQGWLPDFSEARVKHLANLIVRELNLEDLWFTKGVFSITTKAPVTSITVDVTAGSSSVIVASGSFPTSYDNQFIQITGSDAWYQISNVVEDTSFTISSAWDGDTDSAVTCTVAFPRIELPSELMELRELSISNSQSLTKVPGLQAPYGYLNINTGQPAEYLELSEENSSGNREILLLDFPDDTYTIIIVGKKRLTRYTSSGSSTDIPEDFEHVIIYNVLSGALSQDRSIQDAAWFNRQAAIALRKIKSTRSGGKESGIKALVSRGYGLPTYREPEIIS